MKVLFVASGNSRTKEVVPFIQSQGEALKQEGVDIRYFPVVGRGIRGYLRAARALRNRLREEPVDIIHAHYTLSGWVAVLASRRFPIVLSLMGSDAYGEYTGKDQIAPGSRYLTVLTWLIQPFVGALISKSANIERFVYRKAVSHIVPNGVRLEQFRIYDGGCREELGLDPEKKYVLFIGDPANVRKNFRLAQEAVRQLNRPDVALIHPYPVPHDTVVKYLNSADVFALCSFMEGSPNVVKEAMACNCPAVVTDVGDAAWVVGDTPGCYVASFDAADYARQLEKALAFSEEQGRTRGRERLISLGLEARTIARRITGIYQTLLKRDDAPTISQNLQKNTESK